QIKKAIPVGISFLPNQLIVFEVLDSIPFSSALGIAPASVEPSLGECLNHVDSPATGCVLFSTDYLFSLEVNDSGELSIAPKVFLLLNESSVLVIAAEIDLAVVFPVRFLSN